MRNTARKVSTVVAVLTISCQVSEYRNNGPLAAHRATNRTEMMKAKGWHRARALFDATLVKNSSTGVSPASDNREPCRPSCPRRRPPREQTEERRVGEGLVSTGRSR